MRAQTRRNAHRPYLALALCAAGIFATCPRATAQGGTPVAFELATATRSGHFRYGVADPY
jgi:hypothetical protein